MRCCIGILKIGYFQILEIRLQPYLSPLEKDLGQKTYFFWIKTLWRIAMLSIQIAISNLAN
jgi:hypothetical protein